ncbi:MAG TPA: DNA repair protein RecN [Verrucomicrobiae bacterium]|nr:DNA repair protein RecN [Verrucomicrobiae bacterium]
MLTRLEVENFGLIARADIAFAPGATVFTGETGSGKTMLLGALGFALGARAGADAVRRGASKALVRLAFDPGQALRERLAAAGFELDPGEEATIEREQSDAGRSGVRLCGRPATAGFVREIADAVAEIVGQHEHQRLLSSAAHLEMLDRFAGAAAGAQRERVAAAFALAEQTARRLAQLEGDERRALQAYEEARAAAGEISAAAVRRGEDRALDDRRHFLDNVERIATALQSAHAALSGDDDAGGAGGALGTASAALHGVGSIAPELEALASQAAALQSEAGDLAAAVARSLGATEFDPSELEAINARLALLERLKRKYGGTLEAVLAAADAAAEVVERYERRDANQAELAAQGERAQRELVAAARELTALRERAAAALAQSVQAEFAEIALVSARFDVRLLPQERIGPEGAERVEFAFAANAGEPLRPLARVASGGELSRVLLALVVALAGAAGGEVLVFDEIDAGIGGATAAAVGARVARLAASAQVVCVTHLAQLAIWGVRHYVLDKIERAGETTIGVRELQGAAERENEIARMLSGEPHDAALRHARELLAKGRRLG